MPRTITDHLKFWKASELRSWFFFYAIPCIQGIMPPQHFYHFCAFAEGIYLLCQDSVTQNDLLKSERYLQYFVFMMPALYTNTCHTLNVHYLLHLPDCVRDLGPLWCNSAFTFESANGALLKMFHGTQYIDIQIMNATYIMQSIPHLLSFDCTLPDVRDFANKLLGEDTFSNLNHSNCRIFKFLGKSFSVDNDESEYIRSDLEKYVDASRNTYTIEFYSRLWFRGKIFQSEKYERSTRRNSYSVKYALHNGTVVYGFIRFFIKVMPCEESGKACGGFCVVSRLETSRVDLLHAYDVTDDEESCNLLQENFLGISLDFMHFCKRSNVTDIIAVHDLINVCICIESDSDIFYISEEPNSSELNL